MDDRDRLMTVRELAAYAGRPETEVRDWLRARWLPLPHYRVGRPGGIRISLHVYRTWLRQRLVNAESVQHH